MEESRTSLVLPSEAQTDETRARLREMAISSTYFMSKAILGFKDMTPDLHRAMADWIDAARPPGLRRLHGIVPRDHLKTSVWTIGHTIKTICQNPNVRILLGNETSTNVEHFLARIDSVFRRNALFQWLFPELIPDWGTVKRWNAKEITLPRDNDYPEATIEVIGVGGAVVSRHYNIVKLDDLVGKAASEESETMRKTIDWYTYCESLLEHPEEDWIYNVGTPWGYNDLDAWIRKNEAGVQVFERGAYGKPGDLDGTPIWPERFNHDTFERLKKKYGTFKFSCQYLCKPRDPESGTFDTAKIRYYEWRNGNIVPKAGIVASVIDPNKLTRYLRIDPAISERPGAARSAIVVDGVYLDERVFVLETWAQRCQPSDMIRAAFDLHDRWKPEAWGIESVAYQKILKPVIETEAARRGIWINVIELHPDSRTKKENRIRGKLEPYVEQGLIWMHETHDDLMQEMSDFPTGLTVDLLDAFAYGPDMWHKPLEDNSEEEEKEERQFMWNPERSSVTGY